MTIAGPMTLTFDFRSRSQVCLQRDYFLTCNISDNIEATIFKLDMTVDLWMPYMLMLILMNLTLMQGHNGSAKAKKNLHCLLSAN